MACARRCRALVAAAWWAGRGPPTKLAASVDLDADEVERLLAHAARVDPGEPPAVIQLVEGIRHLIRQPRHRAFGIVVVRASTAEAYSVEALLTSSALASRELLSHEIPSRPSWMIRYLARHHESQLLVERFGLEREGVEPDPFTSRLSGDGFGLDHQPGAYTLTTKGGRHSNDVDTQPVVVYLAPQSAFNPRPVRLQYESDGLRLLVWMDSAIEGEQRGSERDSLFFCERLNGSDQYRHWTPRDQVGTRIPPRGEQASSVADQDQKSQSTGLDLSPPVSFSRMSA